MNKTPSAGLPVPNEAWDELLMAFAAKAKPQTLDSSLDSAPETSEQDQPTKIKWLKTTIRGINRLPWHEKDDPDGRKPPSPKAAAALLWLLLNTLGNNTREPNAIIPTWRGGITAEWHIDGVDLEIESDPDGSIEYNFAAPGIQEYEGPAGPDLSQLRQHASMLPERANQANNGPITETGQD